MSARGMDAWATVPMCVMTILASFETSMTDATSASVHDEATITLEHGGAGIERDYLRSEPLQSILYALVPDRDADDVQRLFSGMFENHSARRTTGDKRSVAAGCLAKTYVFKGTCFGQKAHIGKAAGLERLLVFFVLHENRQQLVNRTANALGRHVDVVGMQVCRNNGVDACKNVFDRHGKIAHGHRDVFELFVDGAERRVAKRPHGALGC